LNNEIVSFAWTGGGAPPSAPVAAGVIQHAAFPAGRQILSVAFAAPAVVPRGCAHLARCPRATGTPAAW